MDAMFLDDFELVRTPDSDNENQLSDDLNAIACLSEVAANCSSAAYGMSINGTGNQSDIDAVNSAVNIICKIAQSVANSANGK